MLGCNSKLKHKAFFALAWANAIFSVMQLLPSTCLHKSARNVYAAEKKILTPEQEKELLEKLRKASNDIKIIVAWDWSKVTDKLKDEEQLDKECGSCIVVYNNNSKIYERNTGGVVIDHKSVQTGEMPPISSRCRDQLYIWHYDKPPTSIRNDKTSCLNLADSFNFNGTMTIRRDSHIVASREDASHFRAEAKKMLEEEFNGDINALLKSKTKLVATKISNCESEQAKDLWTRIILDIEKAGVPIDIFHMCSVNSSTSSIPLKNYKFFLVFQDTFHCRNHITEQFFSKSLSEGVIPVVWGVRKEDYKAVAPPDSFIHVGDFKSFQELTDYLIYLEKNDDAYLKYFRWYSAPEKEMPNYGRKTGFCQLCRTIHGINVDDIYKPGFDRSSPTRPLFSNGVVEQKLSSIQDVIFRREDEDCIKDSIEIFLKNKTTQQINKRGRTSALTKVIATNELNANRG